MSSTLPVDEDLYEILGVSKDATDTEIQRAYRKLALKYHPDRNQDDPSAAEKFKKAAEAYEILKDTEKRNIYDSGGMSGVQGTGFQGFQDNEEIFAQFGDVFSDLFGGRGRPGQRYQPSPARGQDLRFSLTVDFRTAALGGKQDVEIHVPAVCPTCKGNGVKDGKTPETCEVCHGRGQVARRSAEQGGYFTVASACPACAGTGIKGEPCQTCRGEGRSVTKKKISISIPVGIESGGMLRLRGQGPAGLRGGPAGDLLIEVKVKSDKDLKRDGANIRSDLHLPLVTALLGGKVDVDTLHGTVSMTIPAGTSSDNSMRIRGQGIHAKSGKGDHLVRVIVDVPKKTFSEEEKEQLNQLLE